LSDILPQHVTSPPGLKAIASPTPEVTPLFAETSVLVPAAGRGERLGLGPKALLDWRGEPLITWLTRRLLGFSRQVIVAAPPDCLDEVALACPGCRCITGGETRQQSVQRLVSFSDGEYVLLADVARPFISRRLYSLVLEAASQSGAAGAFLRPDVPVAEISQGRVQRVHSRHQVGLFQLPHAFKRCLIEDILERAEEAGWREQSTLELAIRAGQEVAVVEGEKSNLKITTLDDWQTAQSLGRLLA
jgi:2-C-methyl-D-erythritol 4-phosphate cytidylyltransferase